MKRILSYFKITSLVQPMLVLLVTIMILGVASCKKKGTDQIFTGTEMNMGSGKVNSFFKVDKDGKPLELGFEMTNEALVGLSTDPLNFAGNTFSLTLGAKALELTPFDHIVINWNPAGHPPAGVYTVPHFDFHLYTITTAEQMAIPPYTPASAAMFDLLPPAGYMPAGYIADAGGIPAMGKHWGMGPMGSFTHTLIYGSYNGKMIFEEPMITVTELQAGNSMSMSFTQPTLFEKTGKWYPTQYSHYKDASTNKYYVTLSGFVKR